MSLDSRAFRNALGSFTTGVCVVTAKPKVGAPFGMTVNSFASVSLDPPLILWSIQKDSDCLVGFDSCKDFAVNILAADQIELSNFYAQRGDHILEPSQYRLGRSGLPLLRGVVSSFECRVWARYPGGDHIIMVGEVTAMEHNPNKSPLLFNTGKYCLLR